jgi:uncharacterized protein (DUF2252 family)
MHNQSLLHCEERKRLGQGRRRTVGRSKHAAWNAKRRTYDVVDLLIAANRDRIPELLPIKMGRMASSPFAFYRGSVPLMAADLSTMPSTNIRVQICGDAHVRNLGAFAAPDGKLVFDVNDFDETVEAPWEWDLKRLGASLILAGREAGNAERVCRTAVREFSRNYRETIHLLAQIPYLDAVRYRVHLAADLAVRSALRKAERSTPLQSLKKLTVPSSRSIRRFKEAKPLLIHVRPALRKAILDSLGSYRETLAPERQHMFDLYRPADVTFKVVGTGSVATRDYVVLMFGNGPGDPLFLQIKEEPLSSYATYVRTPQTNINQGRRVVEGQRRMQVESDPLLGWTSFVGHDYLVRQMSDHKASIDNQDLRGKGLLSYAQTCGQVLAKGHTRSGDPYAIAGYIGVGAKLDKALEKFAIVYADQVMSDYEAFRKAVRAGKIKAARVSA